MSDEFFKVAFRRKLYLSLAELQEDLDAWLDTYNTSRPHHGYRTQGRTPLRAFEEGLATESLGHYFRFYNTERLTITPPQPLAFHLNQAVFLS